MPNRIRKKNRKNVKKITLEKLFSSIIRLNKAYNPAFEAKAIAMRENRESTL